MLKKKKRILCFFLLAVLVSELWSPAVMAESAPSLSLSAESAILTEAGTGRILFEKNPHKRLPMASTTKIMTALTALELASKDSEITVTEASVGVEGSSVYLSAGETLTLEQLLYALLLQSANDAAVAIAVGLCGSVKDFAAEMNRKAAELGLKDTHFENPNGLDAAGHFTTAHDLALITRSALQNPLFCRIAATKKAVIPDKNSESGRILINHNKLLWKYEGAIGVKTGYTKKSGRCLVSAAERNGVRIIAVTLNDPDDWKDHETMLNYGFASVLRIPVCNPASVCVPIPVVGGEKSAVIVSNPEGLICNLPKEHGEITKILELPRFLYGPVNANEPIGTVRFYCDCDKDGTKEQIGSLPLAPQTDVALKKPSKNRFWAWLCSLFRFRKR